MLIVKPVICLWFDGDPKQTNDSPRKDKQELQKDYSFMLNYIFPWI